MEQRQERIKFLIRQEDLKKRLSFYLTSLSEIAGRTIDQTDVVSIEQTDKVWEQIKNNNKLDQAYFSISFPYAEKEKFNSLIKALGKLLSGHKQFFTTNKFYTDCFLLIDTSSLIENYEKVIRLDGDTFWVYDQELKNGFWVDTNEEHWKYKEEYLWTYELRVFGTLYMDTIYNVYKESIKNLE